MSTLERHNGINWYYRRNVLDKLQMKATYTVDSIRIKNIGLGMSSKLGNSMCMSWLIIFRIQDFMKANSLSFNLI
jgi:hypothetical protein